MSGVVSLRAVQAGDLPVLFEHQLDPEALRRAAFTPREREAFEAHWAKILFDPSIAKQAILLDDVLVGHLVCFERDGLREVGYWIGREHWGKGIATQALRLFLQQYAERPLYAKVAKRNIASIRLLLKCGFVLQSEAAGEPDAEGKPVTDVLLGLGVPDELDR